MGTGTTVPKFFLLELYEKIRERVPKRTVKLNYVELAQEEQWDGVWIEAKSLLAAQRLLRKLFDDVKRVTIKYFADEYVELAIEPTPEWLDWIRYCPYEKRVYLYVRDDFVLMSDGRYIVKPNGELQVAVDNVPQLSMTLEEKIAMMRERGYRIPYSLVSFWQSHNDDFILDADNKIRIRRFDGTTPLLAEVIETEVARHLPYILPRLLTEESEKAFWEGVRDGIQDVESELRDVFQRYQQYKPVVDEALAAVEQKIQEFRANNIPDDLPCGFAYVEFEAGHPFTEVYLKYRDIRVEPNSNQCWKRRMSFHSPYQSVYLNGLIAEVAEAVFRNHGIPCKVVTVLD